MSKPHGEKKIGKERKAKNNFKTPRLGETVLEKTGAARQNKIRCKQTPQKRAWIRNMAWLEIGAL